jgi:DNA-binding MarR family transcriptional regulator
MINSRYERELFTRCWKQLEALSAEEEKQLAPALEPAREVSFYQLTPPGIAALHKAGVAEILPDPAFVRMFHRTMDANPVDLEHLGNGQAYLERYQAQVALRQAWEADLERLQGAGSESNNTWEKRILQRVAQEGLCQRSLLETQLGVSFSTISRVVKKLIDQGLLEDVPIVEGPGRPAGVLRLSAAGQELSKELGFSISSAPKETADGAIQERFLHQRVAAIYLQHDPNVAIYRAYTVPRPPVLSSPLGSIFPDLVVDRSESYEYIEIESGKYDYRRLRDKLDKYLAGMANGVWVIADRQNAPTLQHITQWLHDRRNAPLEGIDPEANLTIHYTTIDLLQRHGPGGVIWRSMTYKTEEE